MQRRILYLFLLFAPLFSLSASWCGFPATESPLCCGATSLLFRGGVVPTFYTHRDSIFATNFTLSPPTFLLEKVPAYAGQFKLPWTVGGEAAWNASDRVQLFLQYAFNKAKGKERDHFLFREFDKFNNYESQAGYLGARYYWYGRWYRCLGRVTPFAGFKVGLIYQKSIAFDKMRFFRGQVGPSGGVLTGLEWWWSRWLSVILQGEFVASRGMRPNSNLLLDPVVTGGVSSVSIGSTGWIASFPITLGIRYTF